MKRYTVHRPGTGHARTNLVAAAATGLLLAWSPASAQSGHRMMVVEDNGGGPTFMNMSGPDLHELRQPDFVRDDLPIFNKRLALDDQQRPAVKSLLEGYLASFESLAKTMLPVGAPIAHVMGNPSFGEGFGDHDHGDGNGDADAHGAFGDVMLHSIDGAMGDIDFDTDGGGGGAIMVAVTAGGFSGDSDGGGGGGSWVGGGAGGGGEGFSQDVEVSIGAEAGEPAADVMIAFEGAPGMELSEEDMKKLEEHAQKLAEKIKKKLEEGDIDDQDPLGMGMGPMDIEERQRQFEELEAMGKEMAAGKRLLRQQFINDVQAKLRQDQLERWPSLDRALTRKKTLPKGRLDGERTDLVKITEDLEIPASEPALAEQLHAYEITLHDALTRRNAFLPEAEDRIDVAISAHEPEKALKAVDRATQTRVAVRTVNEQYAASIAGTLDPDTAAAFREQVKIISYPRVYGRSLGLGIFESARQLEGLDESTLLNILELERAYREELDRMNGRIVDTIRKHQPMESRRGIETLAAAMSGELIEFGGDDDPVRAVMRDRRQLERRYVKRLHELLKPDQIEQLPTLPKIRRGPMIIERSTAQ